MGWFLGTPGPKGTGALGGVPPGISCFTFCLESLTPVPSVVRGGAETHGPRDPNRKTVRLELGWKTEGL